MLALGIGAAAGLAVVATVAIGDPELVGRARLTSAATETADAVVAEWRRVREDREVLTAAALLGPVPFAGEIAPPAAPAAAVALDTQPRSATFDVLLREADRAELRDGDDAAALTLVLEALEKSPGPAQRAEGRLRAIQLAARADDADTVVTQLEHVREELDGPEARDGTSYLLLAILAAAPALSASERLELLQEVAPSWRAGRFALPGPAPGVIWSEGDAQWRLPPHRVALYERVVSALGDPVAVGLLPEGEEEPARLRRSALLGVAPGGWEDLAEGRWSRATAEGVFVVPHPATPGWELLLVDPAGLARELRTRLAPEGASDDGFGLVFDGEGSTGEVVRGRTPLEGELFGFRITHPDPDRAVASARGRLRWLRAGLLAMAAFAALAGLATFRALRREHALAETKSTFVANVSHELRTPLSSILLMAENLDEGRVTDPERAARYARLIRREAHRLRRLVDDVLDFARIERGETARLHAEPAALGLLAEDLERQAREHVEAAGGTLRFDAAANLPGQVTLDAEALRRCAINLVDNALKHSGSTEIDLELALEAGDLCLRVRDRGVGLPASRREEVFRPFARLHEGNGAATGTGLGLAIVREVARAHGGTATARAPEDGPGTLFEVRIPVQEPAP